MSVLSGVESDIVSRLLTISYLQPINGGTCRGVRDLTTALNLSHITPPFAIVEYAGSNPVPGYEGPINLGGGSNTAKQYVRTLWDIFLGAENFGGRYDDAFDGTVDDSATGRKGVKTMIDDAIGKLMGYQLTSQATKTYWASDKRFDLTDAVVIYVLRVYVDVLRVN